LSGAEVYEFDHERGTADIRPRRLRAKLTRSLDAYLARTAADLDERGEALTSRRTVLEQHRQQLAELEGLLAESRKRMGADRSDGKIEIELDALLGLLAGRQALLAESDDDHRRVERRPALAPDELSNLEQRVVEALREALGDHAIRAAQLERESEQRSSLLDELQILLQERDDEVAQLRAVVEVREGELAQTSAKLARLQSGLQEIFEMHAAGLALGEQAGGLATGEQPEA
jgi:chromosome segregation ATPase